MRLSAARGSPVTDIVLHGPEEQHPLSERSSTLRYFAHQTKIRSGPDKGMSLDTFLRRHEPELLPKLTRDPADFRFEFADAPVDLDIPQRGPMRATAVSFKASLVEGFLADFGGLDADAIPPKYVLKNVRTGETVTSTMVPHGFDTELQVGQFYENPNLGFNYYCEAITGDLATIVLVPSAVSPRYISWG